MYWQQPTVSPVSSTNSTADCKCGARWGTSTEKFHANANSIRFSFKETHTPWRIQHGDWARLHEIWPTENMRRSHRWGRFREDHCARQLQRAFAATISRHCAHTTGSRCEEHKIHSTDLFANWWTCEWNRSRESTHRCWMGPNRFMYVDLTQIASNF